MNEIIESWYNQYLLNMIFTYEIQQIKKNYSVIFLFPSPQDKGNQTVLTNHAVILSCQLLDEWDTWSFMIRTEVPS